MGNLGAAAGWGVVVAASLLAGAVAAAALRLPPRVAALLTAFRGGVRLAPIPAALLLVLVVVLAVVAYYPFDLDPPRTVRNQVTRGTDGTLRFGGMNAASSAGTPSWLNDARAAGRLQADLEVSSWLPPERAGPVGIMMLADSYWHTDLVIGQDQDELLVWLRRPGTRGNGAPPFVVPEVFRPHRWTQVRVRLDGEDLRVDVDGATRLAESLPSGTIRGWEDARFALGHEVHRGGPWQGEIRRAAIRVPGHAPVDYARPGVLVIPERYRYLPDHMDAPFPPPSKTEWAILVLHLVSFVPVGFLLAVSRRPPLRPLPATLLATAVALTLAAGKFLFSGRHIGVDDVVVEIAGAYLGALLAQSARRTGTTFRRPHHQRT
jgi:VanZ family protein